MITPFITSVQADKKIQDSYFALEKSLVSGIKGTATQANAPTPYDAVTYPNGLFETYIVRTPLTMPNSWGSAVTQAELDDNFVYFDVRNGVVSKEVSLKPIVSLDERIKGWVVSESYAISSPNYDSDGNILSATITWPDGNVGNISGVVMGVFGITSIRFYRSGSKYATMSITYDASGNFESQTVTITN